MYWDVKVVKPEPAYLLYVELDNGQKGLFDMKPYLDHGIFRELRETAYFARWVFCSAQSPGPTVRISRRKRCWLN